MPNNALAKQVESLLGKGKSAEDIYLALLKKGFAVAEIENAIRHHTPQEKKEDHSRRVIQLIVTIGAVLVGAGFFSFIAANWQEMSRPLKVAVIVLSMLSSYASGWYLKEKSKLVRTGEALILLGVIIYGAGIFLVAQMFHIRANWPDGFILWMIGCLAMAYAMESNILQYLAIPLGIVSFIAHPSTLLQKGVFNQFLFTSSFLLLLATAVTFTNGWNIRKKMKPDQRKIY